MSAPDDLIVAIGKVTLNFSGLEFSIKDFVWRLVGSDHGQIPQIVTSELSFDQLVKLLSSLHKTRDHDAAAQAELDAILGRAKAVEGERNQVTHSHWGPGPSEGVHHRIKLTAKQKKGLQYHVEPVTVADINGVAGRIRSVTAELDAFLARHDYDFTGDQRRRDANTGQ